MGLCVDGDGNESAFPTLQAAPQASSLPQISAGEGKESGGDGSREAALADSPGAIPFGRSDSPDSLAQSPRDAFNADEAEEDSLAFFGNGGLLKASILPILSSNHRSEVYIVHERSIF